MDDDIPICLTRVYFRGNRHFAANAIFFAYSALVCCMIGASWARQRKEAD